MINLYRNIRLLIKGFNLVLDNTKHVSDVKSIDGELNIFYENLNGKNHHIKGLLHNVIIIEYRGEMSNLNAGIIRDLIINSTEFKSNNKWIKSCIKNALNKSSNIKWMNMYINHNYDNKYIKHLVFEFSGLYDIRYTFFIRVNNTKHQF